MTDLASPLADPPSRPAAVCTVCGRPLAPDQEWCLECGSGRTVIAGAPDWRLPVLIVAVVLAIVLGGAALLLGALNRHAGTLTVITTIAARPSGGPGSAPTPANWPPGLDGYTVILARAPSRTSATATADHLLGAALPDVGVIDTAEHPEMPHPVTWEVFSGRYPTYAAAQAAARTIDAHGHPGAHPALVQRPGQG
ncbi:hypothetical protein [Conexibacter sp. DBS9H8]|uniref:hypothetical protein n=1 Tax=Conexibacter sp. DBS9H8 TaxID=2937801 RepID=UPI00200DDE48|nr:hypothetical protein [Conexibacter sp. DBS9H8]